MRLPITWRRLFLTWFAMAVAMSANGIVRELVLMPAMGVTAASVASAALGIGLIALLTWVGFRPIRRDTTLRSLIALSATLVLLTVAFECVIGIAVDHKTWRELLAHYALWRGELWPIVLAFLAVTPFLWSTVNGRRSTARRGSHG
jgi:hypothetical protein